MVVQMNIGKMFSDSVKFMETMIELFDLNNLEVEIRTSRKGEFIHEGEKELEVPKSPYSKKTYEWYKTRKKHSGKI